jgi:hypothetical protein
MLSLSSKPPSGLRMPGVTTPKALKSWQVFFSAIERMRLTSSDAVIVAAERVTHNILEAYAQPDKSFDDLRRSIHGEQFPNRLKEFSEACKNELRALIE